MHEQVIIAIMDNWQSTGGVDEYVSWIGANLTHGDFYTSNQTQKWCALVPPSSASDQADGWHALQNRTAMTKLCMLLAVLCLERSNTTAYQGSTFYRIKLIFSCMPRHVVLWGRQGTRTMSSTWSLASTPSMAASTARTTRSLVRSLHLNTKALHALCLWCTHHCMPARAGMHMLHSAKEPSLIVEPRATPMHPGLLHATRLMPW